MKHVLAIAIVLCASTVLFSQPELDKLVATERAFAKFAEEKGTKAAFLEFTAPDGLLFLPDRIKAVDHWKSRSDSKGLLSWAPNYADISSNGMFGYTTGNWEYRPGGKGGEAEGFGEFITIWRRDPYGNFKFVVDIGVSHPRPASYSTALAPPSYPSDANVKNMSAADTANGFFEVASRRGLAAAYETYAAKEVRAYREGAMPMLGKKELISFVKKKKGETSLTKRTVFVGAADLAYVVNTYAHSNTAGSTEKGNFMQIWKLIGGRWQIVLDIFKPAPPPKT